MRRRTGPKANPRFGGGGGAGKKPAVTAAPSSADELLLPKGGVDIESVNEGNDESLLSEVPRKELFPDSEYDPKAHAKDKLFYRACIGLFVLSLLYFIFFSGRLQTFRWMHIPEIKELVDKAYPILDINDDHKEYVVFLSKSDGMNQTALVSMGRSRTSAKNALQDAQAKWIRYYGRLVLGKPLPWIKIDVVTRIHSFTNFDWEEDDIKVPTRWFGIALGGQDSWELGCEKGAIWLPDQVDSLGLLDKKGGQLRWDHIGKELAKKSSSLSFGGGGGGGPTSKINNNLWPLRQDIHNDDRTVLSQVDFFETKSVFLDVSSKKSSNNKQPLHGMNLYHGHRMIATLTSDYLYEASIAAGKYLTRQVHNNGRMVYMYHPRSDVEPDDYGYVRHAGTAYSMALLYKYWKNDELLDATKRSLDHLIHVKLERNCPKAYNDPSVKLAKNFDEDEEEPQIYCFMNKQKHGEPWSSLGLDSLALLAMAQYQESTGDSSRYLDVCKGIVAHIVTSQRKDGSMVQEQNLETGKLNEDAYVLYFPGEAAYAISKLVNVNEQNIPEVSEEQLIQWKQTASNAMDYIVNRESHKSDHEFVNDHWMMYAMAEMRSWHLTDGMIEFGMRTARIAHERQVTPLHVATKGNDKLDEFGIYKTSLSATATATKSEGLCAILPIAIEQNKSNEEEWMWKSIEYGIRYTLGGSQLTPEVAMYMKHPGRVLGALSSNVRNHGESRNDYTQHNLSSYLCLMNLLRKETSGKTFLGEEAVDGNIFYYVWSDV